EIQSSISSEETTMQQGDTGAAVRDLQYRLNQRGYTTTQDGWYGDATAAAVRRFQADLGLVVDGIAGPRTLAALRGDDTSKLLTQTALDTAAARLDVPVASIMAVSEVETAGAGFLSDGRPVILYERHIMYRELAQAGHDADALAGRYPDLVNPKRGGYMGGASEHFRLQHARAIDFDCALRSASWGRYQIMGFHHATCGYDDVIDFVTAMDASECAHLEAFVAFIAADEGLLRALKARKWADFAKRYNGPSYKDNHYDVRLALAYERHSSQ
ncbi:MAG: N-acetylmuramidase family protein, partial [Immundisolibacter sp.]